MRGRTQAGFQTARARNGSLFVSEWENVTRKDGLYSTPRRSEQKDSAVTNNNVLAHGTLRPPTTHETIERRAVLPIIRREGIDWRGGIDGAPLVLLLEFENPGLECTDATVAQVRVAAFGAFLPWQSLTAVIVPSISPGQRRIVTATVNNDGSQQARLRQFLFRSAARRAQTLTPSPASFDGMFERIRTMFAAGQSLPHRQADSSFRSAHFVGNLDVFVEDQSPVERHVDRSYGLRPGCKNLTLFAVGDGRSDSYTFRLDAEPGWEVTLGNCEWGEPFVASQQWIDAWITPPAEATEGHITIWVKRASSGQEVAVEFELSIDAQTLECGRS